MVLVAEKIFLSTATLGRLLLIRLKHDLNASFGVLIISLSQLRNTPYDLFDDFKESLSVRYI